MRHPLFIFERGLICMDSLFIVEMVLTVNVCVLLVILLWRSFHRKLYGYLRIYRSETEGSYMFLELCVDLDELQNGDRVTFIVDKKNIDYTGESGRR